jgi:hypothetical protein
MTGIRTAMFSFALLLVFAPLFVSCDSNTDNAGSEAEFSFSLDGNWYRLSPALLSDVSVMSGSMYDFGDSFSMTLLNSVYTNAGSDFLMRMVIGLDAGFRLGHRYDFTSDFLSSARPSSVDVGTYVLESGWISFSSLDVSPDRSHCVVSGEFMLTMLDPEEGSIHRISDGVFANLTLDYYDSSVIVGE